MKVAKYIKNYVVKSYEVNAHGFLRLLTLLNFLQDIASEHASVIGLGFDDCKNKGVAWVGANYYIKIIRFPTIGEHFSIETWPAETKLWGAVRDFEVKDEKGNIIIFATSMWVLVDAIKHRPVMLKKYFPEYKVINERVMEHDFANLIFPQGQKKEEIYKVRFDDIDVNKHVNNAIYCVWASESIDNDYLVKYVPEELEICFKKEALYGEFVAVETLRVENESFHLITNKDNQKELAICRMKWRELH